MRTVLFVLLLLALLLLLAILVLVIMDRVEEHVHHYQPTYYAALSQAGSAGSGALNLEPLLPTFPYDMQVEKPPTFERNPKTFAIDRGGRMW